MKPKLSDLDELFENEYYRRVLSTGKKSQVVVMNIEPGEDIGIEKHKNVEQILICFEGEGEATLNGRTEEFIPGTILVVPPGTEHNIKSVGIAPLKILTIYTPPNHIDGTVHETRADAEGDTADHKFGPG
jgi:Mannose-6-phosphate isomerase